MPEELEDDSEVWRAVDQFLEDNNILSSRVCISPHHNIVLVSTESDGISNEIYVLDNQGRLINSFDKFDFIRSTYLDLHLVDVNLYLLSALLLTLFVLSGGSTLLTLLKTRNCGCPLLFFAIRCW